MTTDHVEGDERSRTYVTRDHVGRDERSQQKNPRRTLTSTQKEKRAPARASGSLSQGNEKDSTDAADRLDLSADLDALIAKHQQESNGQRTSAPERREALKLLEDARDDGFSLAECMSAIEKGCAEKFRREQGPSHTSLVSILKSLGKLLAARPSASPDDPEDFLARLNGRDKMTAEERAEEADRDEAYAIGSWIGYDCETGPEFTATTEELHDAYTAQDQRMVKDGDEHRDFVLPLERFTRLLPVAQRDLTETHGIWSGIRLKTRTPAGALAA